MMCGFLPTDILTLRARANQQVAIVRIIVGFHICSHQVQYAYCLVVLLSKVEDDAGSASSQ
eukprot:7625246-Karenia_brevis.AAC.1